MRRMLAIIFGMLLGNAAVLYAADEAPQADTSEDQTAEEMLAAEAALEAQEAQAGATEEPRSESTNPVGSNGPETAATGRTGSDNEDFVPTIQISEDLSVSFPVDI